MKKTQHRQKARCKRGRKKGSKTTHTIRGASLHENAMRAIWGKAWTGQPNDAVTWTHQLWIALHQNPGPRTIGGHVMVKSAEVIAAELEVAKKMFVDCVEKKLAAKDVDFFTAVAAEVERLVEIETRPSSPYNFRRVQRASLSFYAETVLKKNAGHRFTWSELLDGVDWRGEKGTNFRPSHAQLKRLCGELAIPVARGKAQRIRRN